MNKSKIEWCDSTWNPVTGCLHGCTYCYAEKIAKRFAKAPEVNKNAEQIFEETFNLPSSNEIHTIENSVCVNGEKDLYPYEFEPTFHKYRLEEPSKKTKPQNIFVCSME